VYGVDRGRLAAQAHGMSFVEQILEDYRDLEPDQSDSWNPVGSKFQLGYRLNLFFALARALQRSERPLHELRVLDLGCGNGRSARMYLDMGLHPEQISGLDLRSGAIALARKLNPAIRFELYDGADLPTGHNWLSTTTVFRPSRRAKADSTSPIRSTPVCRRAVTSSTTICEGPTQKRAAT
jgi:SAM-dependent methyltransferase